MTAPDPPRSPALTHTTWPARSAPLAPKTATPDDVDATWRIRQRAHVSHWLTRAPATLDEYRSQFLDPAQSRHDHRHRTRR